MRYTILDVPLEVLAGELLAGELLGEEPCEPTRVLTREELDEILEDARDVE